MCAMSDHEYKNIIHTLVIPENLPDEEKEKRYQPLIDFLKSNTPDKLFRFRSCKERAFSEFDQDILSFSPASEMNDDFDGTLYFDKKHIEAALTGAVMQQTINGIIESFNEGAVQAEIKDRIPEAILQQMIDSLSSLTPEAINLLLGQFTDFATESYDKRMTFISQVTQNQKIACLSRRVESAAMWGYYANNGTGFALSYDLREPNFSEYCLVPVIYDDERFNATKYAEWLLQQQTLQRILISATAYTLYPLLQHIIPCSDLFMSTKILIHKANSWNHEKEWRLVFYEKNSQGEKYPHIFKRPTALYLGRNISTIHEKILRHIAVEKNIPAYKMMICEESQTYSLYPQLL